MKKLKFENRAWKGDRWVSNRLKTGEEEYKTFEIGYHFPLKKFYVEEDTISKKGTYGGIKHMCDIKEDCFKWVGNKFKVKIVKK